MADEKPRELKISIDDQTANGHYANFANILHNPTEFVVDFGRVVPGRDEVRIQTRIIATPFHIKQILLALQNNVALYEQKYGEIRGDWGQAGGAPPRGVN
jgi:hypothetical protein